MPALLKSQAQPAVVRATSTRAAVGFAARAVVIEIRSYRPAAAEHQNRPERECTRDDRAVKALAERLESRLHCATHHSKRAALTCVCIASYRHWGSAAPARVQERANEFGPAAARLMATGQRVAARSQTQ